MAEKEPPSTSQQNQKRKKDFIINNWNTSSTLLNSKKDVVEMDNPSPTFLNLPQCDIPQLDGDDSWMDGISTSTNNSFFALQGEVNNLTGLIPGPGQSETNNLQGVDTSREPTMDDLRPKPGNPWIKAASMRHCGFPMRESPGGIIKEVQ